MLRIAIVISSIALILAGYSLVYTPTPVVFVDSAVLLTRFDRAIAAKQKLEEKAQEWNNNALVLEKGLDSLRRSYEAERNRLKREEMAGRIKEIRQREEEYARYTGAIQQLAVQEEQRLMQPVFDELNVLIKQFAKDNSYRLVLGTVAGGNILYGHEEADVTAEFLEYLNDL
jgi:Skp family chaperone for outer membrane proteins